MTTEPKRLFDTEGGELAAAIGAARRRTADPSRMAAMGARLAEAGVLPADGFAQTAASSSAASLAPAAAPAFSKWLITGIGVGGVASLALVASLFGARSQASDASAASAASAASEIAAAVAKPTPTLAARDEAPLVVPEAARPAVREVSDPESSAAVAPKSETTTPTVTKSDVSE